MEALMTSMVISLTLTCMFMSMKEEKPNNPMEMTSFECGFYNMNDNKMTFSTNFIMVVMLFIMFDIEVSIMIPMLMKSSLSMSWAISPMAFLAALTMILMKEWATGTVEWNK